MSHLAIQWPSDMHKVLMALCITPACGSGHAETLQSLSRGWRGKDKKPSAAARQVLSPSKQHRTANAGPLPGAPSVKEQSQSLSGFHLSDTVPATKGALESSLDCHN